MKKIVLIDGHSILNRAFFGLPDMTNAEGLHTNAVFGFLNILFRILEEEEPEYLTVAFDVHAPTFRHEMYDAYKGTRKPMLPELREQVPMIKEVLSAMQIPIVEKAGLEADDILGTISRHMIKEGLQTTIVSGDRDLLQLAHEQVLIRIPKTKGGKSEIENYLPADVKETYGVTPEEFIDVKALMGDSSDNVPGAPGIGEKTATKIIQAYSSIDNAYQHLEEIKPPKAKKSMEENRELILLSRDLVTIRTDADFPFSLEEAKIENFYTKEAYALFKRLGFKRLLDRFEAEEKNTSYEEHFHILDSTAKIEDFWMDLASAPTFSFSILQDQGILKALAISYGGEAYCLIPTDDISAEDLGKSLLFAVSQAEQTSVFGLKQMFHAIPLSEEKLPVDLMVGAYLLNPLKSDYSYEEIAEEYAGITMPSAEELLGKKVTSSDFEEKKDFFFKYLLCQAYAAELCRDKVLAAIAEKGMTDLFFEIEMPLIPALASLETTGIRVEKDELASYGANLSVEIEKLEEKIYDQAEENFNINSPKQLGVILFEKLGLPAGKKTKTGYSTAAGVLEKLAVDYPIVENILNYRTLTKLKSTYADGLSAFIADDNRIHGRFHQTVTATGRISSADPNLQNIPVRMELGRQIRKVFVPEEGYVFLDADYSQIELRILASLSEDENLIDAYKEDRDIHRITASQVFHVPLDEVTDLMRRNAKAVNFGIVYGISGFGLSQGLSVSRKEAQEYIDSYFATYPKVKAYLDHCIETAKAGGFVRTLYGRIRPIPELSSGNFMQRQFGERVAMNSPIQGTAADIMKIAMIHVYQALKKHNLKSRIVLQVHDELLVETALDEVDIVKEIMYREMQNAASLAVPLDVELHEGNNWLEAK